MIEPLSKSRKQIDVVKTRVWLSPWDKFGGYLFTDPSGGRLIGGVNLLQAPSWNVRSLPSMLRERIKWQPHEILSTKAAVRVGLTHSSEEGS
jgi:hypothetical protein